jgi:hypothetical protein
MQKPRFIWQNPWTLAGIALSVIAVLFFISFEVIDISSPTSNPYTGLWTYMVLPALLILGLILMPLGLLLERKRRKKLFPDIREWPKYPQIDLNNPIHRKMVLFAAVGTFVVVPLIGISSYKGYHYTDSTQFCGQVCHSVMSPEYTSFSHSPHSRVGCAACHIGSGASWYVKSKISGIRQVFAVTLNTYSRPIPTPIENLRPGRETCEQCHWPAKFFGSQLRTIAHYASDEKNTRSEMRLLIKTGGAESTEGRASGIHWHMALSNKIEYIAADKARHAIPWVRATDQAGIVTIYRSDGKSSDDPPPSGELRRIDCMDCHNRPTHIIQSPDLAVNASLDAGRIDRQLPFIKKVLVEALTESYSTNAEADSKIESYIRNFYQKSASNSPGISASAISQAVKEVRAIYQNNFFPEMRVNWRTYPDNIGHKIFDGCFRCHDNKHVNSGKGPIRQDCTVCHAFQERVADPGNPDLFKEATPQHPYKLGQIHADLPCSSCHTGGRAPMPSCAGCHTTQSLFRQGKSPGLPGLKGTPPAIMADLDCDSCHDVSKPHMLANVTAQCEGCHSKGYGDMVQMWKDDAQSGRAKASAAIDTMRKQLSGAGGNEAQALKTLVDQMQSTLEQVDKAGPQHNTDFADAIYKQIVKLAAETTKNRRLPTSAAVLESWRQMREPLPSHFLIWGD